jgi:hypothetical protein
MSLTHAQGASASPKPLAISVEMTEERLITYALERAQRHAVQGESIEATLARADVIEAWLRGKLNPSAQSG